MRYKLTIEYDGQPYCGWQIQDDQPTVQQEIETALQSIFQQNTSLTVAGRTDAGVHALGQVAHMDLTDSKGLDGPSIAKALNALLWNKKIAVLHVEAAADDFHARFHACNKMYRYAILNRPAPPAADHKVWHVRYPLDVEAMHQSAQPLLGHHDFSAYRAKECQAKSPFRTMKRLDIYRQGEYVYFEAEAQSFLHHQIRNFIGTFAQIGRAKEDVTYAARVLESGQRVQAGQTAPPQGLYLVRVDYPV